MLLNPASVKELRIETLTETRHSKGFLSLERACLVSVF